MKKKRIIRIFVPMIFLLGIGVWVFDIYEVHSPVAHAINNTNSLQSYNQIKNKYGIDFVPADAASDISVKISSEQAISNIKERFNKDASQMNAIFGYSTTDGKVLVQPNKDASKMNNGRLNRYPVWLVEISNVPMENHGGNHLNNSNFVDKSPKNDTLFAFVDAKNGQFLYAVAINSNQE